MQNGTRSRLNTLLQIKRHSFSVAMREVTVVGLHFVNDGKKRFAFLGQLLQQGIRHKRGRWPAALHEHHRVAAVAHPVDQLTEFAAGFGDADCLLYGSPPSSKQNVHLFYVLRLPLITRSMSIVHAYSRS